MLSQKPLLPIAGLFILTSLVSHQEGRAASWHDISFHKSEGHWEFSNSTWKLRFTPFGQWQGLQHQASNHEYLASGKLSSSNVEISYGPAYTAGEEVFLGHDLEVQQDPVSVVVRFHWKTLAFPSQADGEEEGKKTATPMETGKLTRAFRLTEGDPEMERTVQWSHAKSSESRFDLSELDVRVRNFVFDTVFEYPESETCLVSAPGPFWPDRMIPPGTQLSALSGEEISLHSAPEAGLGLIVFEEPSPGRTVGTWMDTGKETAWHTRLQIDSNQLTIRQTEERAYRVAPGQSVESSPLLLVAVKGGKPELLSHYRKMCEQTMPVAVTPDWVQDAVILEAYPQYYEGGFQGLTRRLPFYREIGINTLYLMPHWLGGYSPIDLYTVHPELGTSEDLQHLVETAHELGMKVLFDMVIHGFNEESPVPKNRPEMFVKSPNGKLARHRTWKSVTTDWADPAYHDYMERYVLHEVLTYGIDGFRVDAASYKGPSWEKGLPYPAYRPGSAATDVMETVLATLRKHNPNAVLLSEVFGPVFYSVCNFVHDNQTEAPQYILEQIEAGHYTARDYQMHIADVFDALPAGANRVFFSRNHDTSWFYHFNGYTPRFMALEAIHTFCSIPEVFSGDPQNGPNPDDDPSIWEHYRKLFAAKHEYPELRRGALLLREIRSEDPMIFSALRRTDDMKTLILVSLSRKPISTRVTWKQGFPPVKESNGGSITFFDPIQEVTVEGAWVTDSGPALEVQLQPFQVLLSRHPR